MQNAGDSVCIMRCKLRIQSVSRIDEQPRTGKVRHVRVRLARKYRITFEPLLLVMLYFGVPICSLNQAHGNSAANRLGTVHQVVQYIGGPPLVGLNRQAQTFIARQSFITINPLEDFQ